MAEENIEVRLSKKEVTFIPASQGGKIKQGKNVSAGQVYFGNDKGKRKTSGAYYTPEYIVEYIVQNTVGTKLQKVKDDFVEHNRETLDSQKTASSEEER